MVEGEILSLAINLVATGVTTTTAVSAKKSRDILRRRRYSEEVNEVATEFMQSLEEAIKEENKRQDTNELEGIAEDWSAIVEEILAREEDGDSVGSDTTRNQMGILFEDEKEAVRYISEAIASAEGYDIEKTPQLRDALEAAVSRAYRGAIIEFENCVAGTDLADVFISEANLHLSEQLERVQNTLAKLSLDAESLLTQSVRDEGFCELTPTYFDLGPDPRPERCWRIGFTLMDVKKGFPAERIGQGGEKSASNELLDILRKGEDCLIIAGAGSGKSTLCKQASVKWHESEETGSVFYRESGAGGGSRFESVDSLRRAVTTTDSHTLVAVEDAMQPGGNAVLEVMEKLSGYEKVSFLLEDTPASLNKFSDEGPESSIRARQADLVTSLRRYRLPHLSLEDVSRVVTAFEEATGRTIERDHESIYDELPNRSDAGIGEMLLLSFILPVYDTKYQTSTGLERNVRTRYKTLDPEAETSVHDLSRFNPELLADVGVMVTLLNASGIGIRPELVHSLAHEYGHNWETHDEISDIRAALEGWFLYAAQNESTGIVRTTHRLWSTLYLRELAFDHEERQRKSRRRERSNRRFARCLSSLFALSDNPEHLNNLKREFPDSSILNSISSNPEKVVSGYIIDIFDMAGNWPALAVLFGTDDTACYELPEICSDRSLLHAVEMRGHAHRLRGNYAKARNEYQQMLRIAEEIGNKHAEARGYNNHALVSEAAGNIDSARENLRLSLSLFEDLDNDLGKGMCLSNLGIALRKEGDLHAAQKHHERGLSAFQNISGSHIEAACLGNLGVIAQIRGDLESAHEYLRQSLEIARSLDDRHMKAEAFINMGLLTCRQGNFETALEYVARGLTIEEELGNRHTQAKALGVRALIAKEQKEYETSRECYKDGIELCRQISDTHVEATLVSGLGMINHFDGDYELAMEQIQRSKNIFKRLDDNHSLAETISIEGVFDLARGDSNSGRRKLDESLSILRDIGASLTEMRVLRYHIEKEHELGNYGRVRTLHAAAESCSEEAVSHLGYSQDRVEACYQAASG